jgi:hypothetical protein
VHRLLAEPPDALVRSRFIHHGETADLLGRQIKERVVHAERLEDAAAAECFQILEGIWIPDP